MNFSVRSIGADCLEMRVDAIDTGMLDRREAIRLAQRLIVAAEDVLHMAGLREESDDLGAIYQDLLYYLEETSYEYRNS